MTSNPDHAQLLASAQRSAEKLIADLQRRHDELSPDGPESSGREAINRTLSAAREVLEAMNERSGPKDQADP